MLSAGARVLGRLAGPHEEKAVEDQNADVLATSDAKLKQQRRFKAWSVYLLVVGVLMCFSIGWLRGAGPRENSQQIIALLFWPLLISYLLHGRSKRRDWNKFARWFFWLCLFNPALLVMMQHKP